MTARHTHASHLRRVRAALLPSSHASDSCKHVLWRTNKHAGKQAEVSKQAATWNRSPAKDILLKGKKGDS